MNIRKAKSEDLDPILNLNKALFDYEMQFSDQYNLDWTYSETGKNYFRDRIQSESAIVLVAEENETIIGYIVCYINKYSFRRVNPIAELENMFIDEKYRREGVGKILIQEVKEEAKKKGVKRLKVEALAKNNKALKFYESQGFEDFEVILETKLD